MAKRKARSGARKAKAREESREGAAIGKNDAKRLQVAGPLQDGTKAAMRREGRPQGGSPTRSRRRSPARRRASTVPAARSSDSIPTPPSSLDMNRHGSAARTGRAELEESRQVHGSMTRGITGGDVDVNLEQAYFSGDETPGGDNPTPDQDVVDDIGKAIGIEYQDNEELRASDKVADRDKHRWELDPASAEDYKERK